MIPRYVFDILYIAASLLFIFGLKRMSRVDTARKGNLISGLGMLIAIVATLLEKGLAYHWILLGGVVGSALGVWLALRVRMTGMPEMVALFNGVGGLASLLVGWASYLNPDYGGLAGHARFEDRLSALIPIHLAILIGGVTFTGSLVAYLKLAEKINGKPVVFAGQKPVNLAVLAGLTVSGVMLCLDPTGHWNAWLLTAVALSFVLGVLVVIPIGGADMPVVISLLIVAGGLVGASGLILTQIMCKAMNRSLANVLFSGFGSATAATKGVEYKGEAKPISAEDTYLMLEAAKSVLFVPGYGMAVAQAQHAVKELADMLENNGAEVLFAIHPVAGRMPGHMNVLLAEADGRTGRRKPAHVEHRCRDRGGRQRRGQPCGQE
jgi:NAD(P) transhydrogenase subunit beta